MDIKGETSGAYFKNSYDELVRLSPTFPTTDDAPDITGCLLSCNFHRAAILAKQHNLSSKVINALQECTIYQYTYDFKNPIGCQSLIDQYKLTATDMDRINTLIQTEKCYPFYSYDKATMDASLHENSGWGGYTTSTPSNAKIPLIVWIILGLGIITMLVILKILGVI